MFKNAIPYRITNVIELELAMVSLEERVALRPARPCGALEMKAAGWLPDPEFVMNSGGAYFLTLKINEKILPASVVNEKLAEKVSELEKNKDRKIGRKEKSVLKDEVLFELMPKAFTKPTFITGFINLISELIVVDAPTPSKAEEFLTFLRETLGTLPVTPINLKNSPVLFMNEMAMHEINIDKFELTGRYSLVTAEGEKTARLKGFDDSQEIRTLLKTDGKIVSQLSMSWSEGFDDFILDEGFFIKGIIPCEEIIDKCLDSEDEIERLETELYFTETLTTRLINELTNLCGGEHEQVQEAA